MDKKRKKSDDPWGALRSRGSFARNVLRIVEEYGNIFEGLPRWYAVSTLRRVCGPQSTSKPVCGVLRKEGMRMLTIEGLIAVLSLALTAFGLGYAIGSKDNNKSQK